MLHQMHRATKYFMNKTGDGTEAEPPRQTLINRFVVFSVNRYKIPIQ